MNRRDFAGMLAVASIAPKAFAEPSQRVEVLPLKRNGWMPNNGALPVLFYRGVLDMVHDGPAAACERLFARNGWPPQWRNGVYTFQHYHSTAHEVLGFVAGSAWLMLGGEDGHEVLVRAGDVLLLPVGTGHCEQESTADFSVVGAYPPNQQWDVCRQAPDRAAIRRMAALPYPKSDPVFGPGGPLLHHWKA